MPEAIDQERILPKRIHIFRTVSVDFSMSLY